MHGLIFLRVFDLTGVVGSRLYCRWDLRASVITLTHQRSLCFIYLGINLNLHVHHLSRINLGKVLQIFVFTLILDIKNSKKNGRSAA